MCNSFLKLYIQIQTKVMHGFLFTNKICENHSILCTEIYFWRISQLECEYRMVGKTCSHWLWNNNDRHCSDGILSLPFYVNFHYFITDMWLYQCDDALNVGFELKNYFWFILIKLRLRKSPEKKIAWFWWLSDIRIYWDNLFCNRCCNILIDAGEPHILQIHVVLLRPEELCYHVHVTNADQSYHNFVLIFKK